MEKEIIKQVLNDSLLVTNDINSFLFLRTEGYRYLKQYKLGGGNLLSIMGLFAMLGMMSKIYWVLKKGIDLSDKTEQFDTFKDMLQDQEVWGKYKKFVRKHFIGDINETDAFVELVLDYPEDLGLDKDKKTLEKTWKSYRNKITHIVRLQKDHCAMVQCFPSGPYLSTKKNLPKNKAFYPSPENQKTIREKVLDNPTLTNEVKISIIKSTSHLCYIDQLNDQVVKIKDWIIEKLDNEDFDLKNIKSLIKWFQNQNIL